MTEVFFWGFVGCGALSFWLFRLYCKSRHEANARLVTCLAWDFLNCSDRELFDRYASLLRIVNEGKMTEEKTREFQAIERAMEMRRQLGLTSSHKQS